MFLNIFYTPNMQNRIIAGRAACILAGFPDSRRVFYLLRAALLTGVIVLTCSHAVARNAVLDETVEGVRVVVMPAPETAPRGVAMVSPAIAKTRLLAAYRLLRDRSPFSARHIDRLRDAGEVFLIYDPAFPKKEYGKLTIAAFMPDYFVNTGPRRVFPVVVGRFGIHWDEQDLAGALAHELVGHGMQDLEGKLDTRRTLELECEAWLYQERAHQDLGVDKHQADMIDFRRQLETIWCADYRSYQKKNDPKASALWDRLHPDVDGLLRGLDAFNAYLLKTGVLARVQNARARERRDTFEAQVEHADESGDGKALFSVAMAYKKGRTVPENPSEAVRWLRRAADTGYAPAQFELAVAYRNGYGVAANNATAIHWLAQAAANGHPGASQIMNGK